MRAGFSGPARLTLTLTLTLLALASTPAAAGAQGSGPPVNTVLPVISGTTEDGQTLKATKGIWTGQATITYAYHWERCEASGPGCDAIPSATRSSYKLGHEDVGHTLRILVTASNGVGKESAASEATVEVAPTPLVDKGPPRITGVARVGELLTAMAGTWKGTPPLSIAYQWQLCDSEGATCAGISGATESSYRPTHSQEGDTLRVLVTASNPAGKARAVSLPTNPIGPRRTG